MTPVVDAHGEPASSNGSNGAPWWVQAIKTLGWQVALILALVYFIAKDVRDGQAEALAALRLQSASINELRTSVTELRTSSTELRTTMEAIRRILSVMCSESVKDGARSVGCFQ